MFNDLKIPKCNLVSYSYHCSEQKEWGCFDYNLVYAGDEKNWALTYVYCLPLNAKGAISAYVNSDPFKWGPNLKKFLINNDIVKLSCVDVYPHDDKDKFDIEVRILISFATPIYKVEKLVRIFNRLFDKFLRKQWERKK